MNAPQQEPEAIAVIGMSGRFPNAENPEEFWSNLISGRDCVTRFGDRTDADGRRHVGARSILEHPDLFDAAFFGTYPKEAELMDPQHRIFLECAWEALEDGGCDPAAYSGMIGVYAGLSLNTYLLHNIGDTAHLAENYQVGEYQKMLGNDKDFLPVRVSYKLNLRGPSMAIQTACSTSLVAICQAATALLTYQTDLALAGGVSISFPQERHYLFTEEGMVSPDGSCRAFDAQAAGTVFGHGCGVVLLKRLSEATADGDPILAVIKGWAVNNDGSDKIGFAAPGVNAQAEVISMAQAAAGVNPWDVSYVEAHGTGTPLGDPIEVAALTKAFRDGGATTNQFCALGTGKTHIGHLDVAAGVTGLIKTILQFRHGKIPALLHFQSPNPHIDFANSPFSPVSADREWMSANAPRIAGVSAFGVGGTNAHVVVQEPPAPPATTESNRPVLLTLSAKSEASLDLAAKQLADHLEAKRPSLSDTSYTLTTARRAFPLRRTITADNLADAIAKLRESSGATTASGEARKIAFLFPGQGSQYCGMTRGIYESEPEFRSAMDECAGILSGFIYEDIRTILYPAVGQEESAIARLDQTAITQPCIFAVEYSLARLFMSWGIQPSLLIGHSIGEYVAAMLAETFTLQDALLLLSRRASLMQNLPGGSMLAIRAGFEEITLPDGIDLAALNSPKLCTVAGEHGAILSFQQSLEASGIASRVLKTSHAFHSAAMEPIAGVFRDEASRVHANAPAIPWISTCTGDFMDGSVVSDPSYWSRQLRQPVLFSESLSKAFASGDYVFLEVGPGQALSQFTRQHPQRGSSPVIATLPSSAEGSSDLHTALGNLWSHGAHPDWSAYYRNERRARIHLPTYAFDRKSYWIDNSSRDAAVSSQPLPQASFSPPPVHTPMTLPDPSEKLRALILELSGVPVEDDSATFTELGFDSLFLTQASQAIHSAFGVKITFRQMLGELSSVASISKHIKEVAPQPTQVAVATQAPSTVPLSQPTGGSSDLENALNNQIALIQNLIAQQRAQQPAVASAGNLTPVKWPERFPRSGAAANSRFGPYKPIEKGENGGLTQQQQNGLQELTSRYVRKTPGSKVYAAEHRAHYADPRAVAGFKSLWKEMVYPIVSARSKGGRIWDIDGNEYVDITMGFGTYFFGHSPDWLIPALEEQLKTGIEIGPQSPIAGKLAASIAELTNMDRVTFCNTGSEAVMAAMRLARTITGRQRIVYFTGDYHGMFEEVLVRGAWVDGIYKAQPIAPGIPQSLVENMLVLDYADPASLEILKTHAHELAAVMVEPVQSRAPGIQPRDFMHQVRAITKEAGTALIFDEVVTGFRCHPGGAQAYFGVEADLATYGKVVGGGMPIGVLAGKREYMDALDGGAWNYGDDSFPEVGVTFFAGTFVRHPMALAAASRVIEHLKGEGPRLQIEMEERVARFCRTLNDYFAAIGVPIRIPHFSAHAVIEHAPDLKYASLLWYFLREKGVHIWEGRPLYFTSAHTDADLDHMVQAFVEAVHEMQSAGFLPTSTPTDVQPPARFPRFDSAPTTEAQREIFHAVQMGDDANCSFNESNVIRLSGELDVPALKTALADIVARHPALRSTISSDGATQYFHPSAKTVEVIEHNFAGPGGAESRSATLPLSLLKEAESSTPFDLTNGPLARFQLVHLSSVRHELIFTAHHLICDGWSFGMIIAELGAAYNARKANRLPMLAPAMSFADYARLETALHLSDERDTAEAFWIDKFTEPAPVLELPTDFPRPLMKSYRGSMEAITLCGDRYARLKKAAPRLGGTLFATLLSSFATLLHRLTNQEDIVIGVPAAGQTRIGRDELIGHCLNFLPLRLRPAATTPFEQFASDVKEQVLEAYDHQNYTFGSLLRKIQITRDTSRVPLVSVIFNIDKTGIDHVKFDGLEVNVSTNPKQFVNFDLFFNLVQTDDKLVVECEYNTDLHDRTTILGWLAAYEQLIESAISEPFAALGNLEIVGGDNRQKLLHDWNDTEAPLPAQASIHQMFEEQVDKTPNAIALRAYGRTFTYGQLDGHANALAKTLRENGATRETLVGVCADRSPEMLVAILAILKSGAAYVPIDPKYPAERIAYILQDSKAPLLLTQRAISGTLPPLEHSRTLYIDDVLTNSTWRDASSTQPADLAYVIYTSGSTGQPKGVAIEHRNTTAFIAWAKKVFTAEELGGVLFSTSICFDLSIFEMFVTLSSGGTVILAANALDLKNHPHLADITLINTVPSAISELVDAKLVPPSVKVINLAGEALPTALVDRIYQETSVAKVYDLYGPSEDTTYSTFTLRKAGEVASIGKPISNTRAYVLDPNGKLLPPGVPGELHLGGAGLARGYLHRPELTASKFIRDAFSSDPSARLYKTGDLVRHFENGELQFLGRLDHQVKLRGYRIELGEIESLLASHPSVEQAVATVHDGKIAAYLKTSGNPTGEGTTIWESQWDLLYTSALEQSGGAKLDRLDSVIAGWAGVDNLDAQVTEWIDTTIDRIRGYEGRRILEIGCGTGQILSRLAPAAEAYWAADISQVAIEALRKNHPQPQVKLFHRPADDFSGIPDGYFDTVILNSVAQYFPSADYLSDVLEKAAITLRPGGRIFLGDIQSNALLPIHHAEALAARAPNGTTAGQLREKVTQRLAGETELSLDPDWFTHLRAQLPSLAHTEILLRRGKITNETNIYHYDVVLHVGQAPALVPTPVPTPWKNLNLEQLEALLMDSSVPLYLTDIPDARLASALAFHNALVKEAADSPLPQASPPPTSAVSSEDLFAVAANLGFRAHVRWQGDGTAGMMEAVLIPKATTALPEWPAPIQVKPARACANQPASAGSKANTELSSILRSHLSSSLPDYMIPASFTVLENLPLTPNGKIDRKALPAPSSTDEPSNKREILPPRNETERQLVEIWKQVLGKADVGISDDIFDLGGDSILIFQITTRATRAGISISPAQVFRQRTIAALSSVESPVGGDFPLPIQRVNRDAYRRKN
jgi:amino acid adenylation domain-containing protein